MPNGIPCKFCGQQCTDHEINLPDVRHSTQLRKGYDSGSFVCEKYVPSIQIGVLSCTCTKKRKWCNGLCIFNKVEIEQD